MNTHQIANILQADPFTYRVNARVYASDEFANALPSIVNSRSVSVVNTDPSNLPGRHWIAICTDGNGTVDYFDSYGLPPLNYDVWNSLRRSGQNVIVNKTLFQGITTNVCGEYSVLYSLLRARRVPANTILTMLDETRTFEERDHGVYNTVVTYTRSLPPLQGPHRIRNIHVQTSQALFH